MRKLCVAVAVCLCAAVAGAEVFRLDPASAVTVTCLSGGGAAATITTGGYYELHVSGETSHVCFAATCASGGMERVVGNHGVYLVQAGSVSCRSDEAGGVVQFVPAVFVR